MRIALITSIIKYKLLNIVWETAKDTIQHQWLFKQQQRPTKKKKYVPKSNQLNAIEFRSIYLCGAVDETQQNTNYNFTYL